MFGFRDPEKFIVGRHDDGTTFVSTAKVTGGKKPYETAVEHPAFNEGKIVIVEAYDAKSKAAEGHVKWVQIMTHSELPATLTDVGNSPISQLLALLDEDTSEFKNTEE